MLDINFIRKEPETVNPHTNWGSRRGAGQKTIKSPISVGVKKGIAAKGTKNKRRKKSPSLPSDSLENYINIPEIKVSYRKAHSSF